MRRYLIAILWINLVCMAVCTAAFIARPALWPLTLIALAIGMGDVAGARRRLRRLHSQTAPPPPVRTPVFPAAVGCPAGCCPICGMHDADGLVNGVHKSCVEWLGYVPLRQQERLGIQREIRRYKQMVQAEAQAEERRRLRAVRQAACPHKDVDSDCFCGECGARLQYRRDR